MFRRITSIILILSSLALALGMAWGTAKVYAQAATATLTPTRTSTAAACPTTPTYYATVSTSTTNMGVGQQIVVTMTSNVGIASYWISIIDNATGAVQDSANPILTPTLPGTQTPPAGTYTVQWTLNAVRAGSVTINGTAYGEMQSCINGTITWSNGGRGAQSGVITVSTVAPTPTQTFVPGDLGVGTVNGKLTNATTGAAIAGATVSCSHTSYTSQARCTGSTITAADGTYVFPNVFFHDTDTIVVSAIAAGYTSQTVVRNGGFTTPNWTLNFAMVPTSGQADLIVVSITEVTYVSPSPTPNAQGCWPPGPYGQILLRVTVKNNGTADAGNFAVDLNGSVKTVTYLGAGMSAEVDYAFQTIPRTRTATVDSSGLVPESNETNNTLTVTLPAATATRTGTPRPQLCNVTNTPTRTPTITNTPTRTATPTGPTPTFTRTPTRTNTPNGATCSPVNATITAPFTFDGAGTFCWQSSNLGSYINNWNNTSVTINGVNITNMYVASGSYPAKIGGFWYVTYNSTVAWSHFEAK